MAIRKKNYVPKTVEEVQRAVTDKDFQTYLKQQWAPHIPLLMRKSLDIAQQDDMVGHRERTLIYSYLFGKPDDNQPAPPTQDIQFNFTLVNSKEEAKSIVDGTYQVVDVTPVPEIPEHLTNDVQITPEPLRLN